jgi:hypothetical protein
METTETKVEHRHMTDDEKVLTMYNAVMLYEEGKDEEASRLIRSVPLEPEMAKIFKKIYGPDFVANGGFNLFEVEKAYGKEWLYQ